MTSGIVTQEMDQWVYRDIDDREQSFDTIKYNYTRGDEDEKKVILDDLATLSSTHINFKKILDDTSGSLGFDEFDKIMSSGRLGGADAEAIKLHLHTSNGGFKSSIGKYTAIGTSASSAEGSKKKQAPLGKVGKNANGTYYVEDTGLKSIMLAVGFMIPTLVNTVTFTGGLVGSKSILDQETANNWKSLLSASVSDATVPDIDVLNEVASCLVFFSHVMLETMEDVESSQMFDDSRMYVIDILLSFYEVGVTINGTVVGDEDGLIDGGIEYDTATNSWIVHPSKVVLVKRTSSASFYDTKLVGPMYAYYDTSGTYSPIDLTKRQFWERIVLSIDGVSTPGGDLMAKIRSKLR